MPPGRRARRGRTEGCSVRLPSDPAAFLEEKELRLPRLLYNDNNQYRECPSMCYQIAEWSQRYEVSIKGREPRNGEELRAGPLSFIRLKVYGHKQGTGYRRLASVSGDRLMEVFGIFCKLLEISGNQQRENRGKIFNEKDTPASIDDIAFILGISGEKVGFAMEKLCEVGWVIPLNPGDSGESGTLLELNTTQHNSTQLNSSCCCYGNAAVNGDGSGMTTTTDLVLDEWGKLPLPEEKKHPKEAERMVIERAISNLMLDTEEPIHEGMIIEAIGNYKQALKLPKSQTYKHKLFPFLTKHIKKYVSYNFDIEHHDGSQYGAGGKSIKSHVEQLKIEGILK